MIHLLKLIFGNLFERSTRRQPRPQEPAQSSNKLYRAPTDRQIDHCQEPIQAINNATKKKALNEADVRGFIECFPIAKVVHVLDGDTVIVAKGWEQVKIRLDSIDCPEDGQHWGNTAAYGLIKLIGGRKVYLEEHGIDVHGRTLATIYARHSNGESWINVNERMVTLGHAWVMRRYYDHLPRDRQDKLNRLENWARSKKVGLWRTQNPIPPWQWRRSCDRT